MKGRFAIGLITSFLMCTVVLGQANEETSKLSRDLKDKISKAMPGWVSRSIEPITGSKNVTVQHWGLGNIIVKIAITEYETPARVEEALKNFKSQLKTQERATTKSRGRQYHIIKEDLPMLGDSAFALDIRGSEAVAFKKGRFLVNVSVVTPENNTDVFFSRKFAEHVAKALE
jgi:uncharacterized Fe-S cluster-containing radical SAM superfamily enzyme